MSEVEKTNNESTEKGFFWKLINGDLGLAKTYWIFGVLGGSVISTASGFIDSIAALVVYIAIHAAYNAVVMLGVWKAAKKYQGRKIWATLAQVMVILVAVSTAFALFLTIPLLGKL